MSGTKLSWYEKLKDDELWFWFSSLKSAVCSTLYISQALCSQMWMLLSQQAVQQELSNFFVQTKAIVFAASSFVAPWIKNTFDVSPSWIDEAQLVKHFSHKEWFWGWAYCGDAPLHKWREKQFLEELEWTLRLGQHTKVYSFVFVFNFWHYLQRVGCQENWNVELSVLRANKSVLCVAGRPWSVAL